MLSPPPNGDHGSSQFELLPLCSPQSAPAVFHRPEQLLLGFLKRLLAGWGANATARILLGALRILRRPGGGHGGGRLSGLVQATLTNPGGLRFGLACGVLSLVYNLSHRGLHLWSLRRQQEEEDKAHQMQHRPTRTLQHDEQPMNRLRHQQQVQQQVPKLPDSIRARNAAISGALAGALSWSLVRRSETSETFALHILVRALAMLARHVGRRLRQTYQLPAVVKLLLEHTDSAVFIASCTEVRWRDCCGPSACRIRARACVFPDASRMCINLP